MRNELLWENKPLMLIQRASRILILSSLGSVLVFSLSVQGEPNGFFIGTYGSLSSIETIYKQAVDVDNRERKLHDSDIAKDTPITINAFIGYRANLGNERSYWSAQAELALGSPDIEGALTGVRESVGCNLMGESCPETWALKSESEIGLTIKYGLYVSAFGTLELSPFILAGVRQSRAELVARFRHCLLDDACEEGQFESASFMRNPELMAWTAGVGLGFSLTGRTGLQIDARYTDYLEDEWVTDVPEQGVAGPASLSSSKTSLNVSLVRYF